MPIEIEAKFAADHPGILRSLAAASRLGEAMLGPPRRVDELDRYLDTADGRLAAQRWACRLRRRDDVWRVSLKGPPDQRHGGMADWLHVRPELEGPAGPDADPAAWPSSPARDRLAELTGGGSLVEQLRLHQAREERTVSVGAERLGLLSLDEVHAEDAAGRATSFCVVELELRADREPDVTALRALATHLAATPGLAADPRTKLERALAALTAVAS
jgi:inorganic triphosphatase YgiF